MDGAGAVRVAMWSGPRNISTAMLRSWGNRADTVVCDEPLYAHYLLRTGLDHPGAAEIQRHHETDWRTVVEQLSGALPPGKTIFYQKQMAHHLLPEIDRAWLRHVTHCFLIRDPREMLTSLVRHLPHPRIEDTGLPQQLEIFEMVRRRSGEIPAVIDSRDVLLDPEGMLRGLCGALGVPFDSAMLCWPAGPRETDGVWARYWYAEVERSTRFAPYRAKADRLPDELTALHESCRGFYDQLHAHRLRPRRGRGSAAAPPTPEPGG